jgi:hypothetical protein
MQPSGRKGFGLRTQLPPEVPTPKRQPEQRFVISPFTPEDESELFAAYASAVAAGGSFPRRPPADLLTFRAAWLSGMTTVQVGRLAGRVAGSYFLRPAFPDAASHIANAGYLVVDALRGRGFGAPSWSTRLTRRHDAGLTRSSSR